MISVLSWGLLSTVVGWAAFPIAWRIFPALRDRGYGLARALGLLVAGYSYWILTLTGAVRNDLGGAWAGAFVLIAGAVWAGRGQGKEILRWARAHIRMLVGMEVVFLGSYLVWCLVRSANPEIVGTEKPMELMFLNAILRSPEFPPHDAWLSGYAISYYYFGYVLAAWLTRITGVFSGIAFNLTNALWFALTALGAASLVYNLLPERWIGRGLGRAWLGPAYVLVSGNLGGFLEVLHSRHVFWATAADGTMTSAFWTGLGIKELDLPPPGPPAWISSRYLWWWRASRVVRDRNLLGGEIEVIDEFPFFSFLLADNHPHLLALPFVLLAIGFGLQIFLGRATQESRLNDASERTQRVGVIVASVLALAAAAWVAVRAPTGETGGTLTAVLRFAAIAALSVPASIAIAHLFLGRWTTALAAKDFWTAAWLLGALAFLNTWDFPISLTLLAALIVWGMRARGRPAIWFAARTAFALAVMAFLLYVFWYLGFSSQAGGILPNVFFPTRFDQFAVMFAPALTPIVFWLVRELWKRRQHGDGRLFAGVALGVPLALLLFSSAVGAAAFLINVQPDPARLAGLLGELGAPDVATATAGAVARRAAASVTALVLGSVLGSCAVILRRHSRGSSGGQEASYPFVAMLIALGALLVLTPEFLYLKDTFGTRMNTIFKFYFAAWILWGLAAAWIAAQVLPRSRAEVFRLRQLVLLPLALGMVYPVLATWTKTNGFNPPGGLTLDGTAHLAQDSPEDALAIDWMNANLEDGVIAETVGGGLARGVGGSYSAAGRISAHTGLPTVLGWPGHELQWRGGGEEMGSREQDIYDLYVTRDWDEAQPILARYGIDYVYVGPLERSAYPPLFESKFAAYLEPIYQAEGVMIYAVPDMDQTNP